MAKAATIAQAFGSGHNLDSYLLAFLIPSFLADIICGSIVPASVPEFVALNQRNLAAEMHSFYGTVLRDSLKLGLAVSTLCAIGAGAILVAGLSGPRVRLVSLLILPMLPVIPCAGAANVWRALLNARNQFAAAAFTAALAPLFLMALVFTMARTGSVWALAIGTTLASFAEIWFLGWSVRRAGLPIWPRNSHSSYPQTSIRREYRYLVATAALGGGNLLIGQLMVSSLGNGSVSILNYGTRLASVLLALGPAALNVAILPRFSQLAAAGDWTVLQHSIKKVLGASIAASALVAIALFALSPLIVRLSLERGAFTAADTASVAAVQAISMLQLPFLVGVTVLVRVLSAMKANQVMLPAFTAVLLLSAALSFILMERYRVSGIAMASCIGQAALFSILMSMVFREGRRRFLIQQCE